MNPNILKEYPSNDIGCDTILTWCKNDHLRELIEDHKDIIVAMLGGGKIFHVIHGD
jgi:hypothetical protein